MYFSLSLSQLYCSTSGAYINMFSRIRSIFYVFFVSAPGRSAAAFQYQVRNDTDHDDHKTDDLGLLKWTNHQAVCSERLHKESLQRIEDSVEKQNLSLELPMVVYEDEYQEKNEAPDGLVEESGVIGLPIDDHRPGEIRWPAVGFSIEVITPAAD